VLGAWVLDDDGTIAVLHQFADAQIDGLRLHVRGVDLGPLVVIDVVGVRQCEAVERLAEIDVEESLLRAPAELLGVQSHLMGQHLLRRQLASGYRRHTRTSSS
jgi:hypothetical protein